jgi:hypothetical protein
MLVTRSLPEKSSVVQLFDVGRRATFFNFQLSVFAFMLWKYDPTPNASPKMGSSTTVFEHMGLSGACRNRQNATLEEIIERT